MVIPEKHKVSIMSAFQPMQMMVRYASRPNANNQNITALIWKWSTCILSLRLRHSMQNLINDTSPTQWQDIKHDVCTHTHTQGLSLNTWAQRTAKIYSTQHLLNSANALERGGTQHWKTMSHKETSLSNGTCKLHHMPQNACEHSNSHRVYNSNEKDYCKYLNQTTSENVRNI